jgi:hypothetical protein
MPGVRPARWNIVSVCLPLVGFLCGYLVGTMGEGVLWEGHPMDGIFWGILVWSVFCIFGLLASAIAWLRTERRWGLTVTGFILNAILPFALFCSGLSFLMSWLRYG